MSFCSHCGHAAAEGAKFCVNCGNALPAQSDGVSTAALSSADASKSQAHAIGSSSGSAPRSVASSRDGETATPRIAKSGGRRKVGYAAGIIVFWIVQGAALLLVNAMSGPSGPNDVGPSFFTKAAFGWLIGGFVSALIGKFVIRAIAADISDASIRTAFTVTLIVSGFVSLALLGFSLFGFIFSVGMVLAFYAGLALSTSI